MGKNGNQPDVSLRDFFLLRIEVDYFPQARANPFAQIERVVFDLPF